MPGMYQVQESLGLGYWYYGSNVLESALALAMAMSRLVAKQERSKRG